jgi:hypothetical protein
MNRRKCIRLDPIEHETLERLYVERRIATDRYMHRRGDLREITSTFNGLTGRDDTPEDVLHYMQTQRRRKGSWPTLDGTHRRLPVVLGRLIDPEHIETLKRLYGELGVGAERFAQDRVLSQELERRFFEETGQRKSGCLLGTAMLELRKEGNLPKLGPRGDGFNDFDAAEGLAE